jgi:hypothetical protein
MGETINAYKIVVEKPQEKKPLGTLRRRWEDNIKIDLMKLGWERVETGFIWLRIGIGN